MTGAVLLDVPPTDGAPPITVPVEVAEVPRFHADATQGAASANGPVEQARARQSLGEMTLGCVSTVVADDASTEPPQASKRGENPELWNVLPAKGRQLPPNYPPKP
jgi:hypothetical protein